MIGILEVVEAEHLDLCRKCTSLGRREVGHLHHARRSHVLYGELARGGIALAERGRERIGWGLERAGHGLEAALLVDAVEEEAVASTRRRSPEGGERNRQL